MAINAGSVYGELILKGDQYFDTLDKAQKNIDGFADKLKNAGEKMQSVGKSMMLKVTTPLVAIGTAGTKMALDLQNGIKKVSTLADKGILPVSKIETEVKAISNASGIAQTEIAEAIYSALSAGVESENVLEFVRSGIDLTRAGFTSMETAIDATTTVLNAYGENAYDVGKIHDIFVQTQDKGKISVDELGSSIGRVIPTASSLGVNLDQLGAGYAILTAKGQNAQLATTNFNAMLGELGKTGSDTDEALRDLTGKSFKELMEGGMSVGDVLGILNEHAIENGLSLKDMFGSMNAGSAAVTLISDGVEGFNKSLDDMNDAAGKTAENAATMEDGWFKINKAVTQVKNAMIEFGAMIAPIIESMAEKVSGLVEKFSNLDEGTKKIILAIGALAAAIGPVILVAGQMATGISSIVALFAPAVAGATATAGATTGLSAAIAAITGPIGIAVAAIAAITAAVVYLWKTNEEFRDKVKEVWEQVKATISTVLEAAQLVINTFVDQVTKFWDAFGDTIMGVIDTAWNFILNQIESILNIINGVINTFIGLVTGDWERMGEGLQQIWTGLWNSIKNVVNTAWDLLKGAFDLLWTAISNWFVGLAKDALSWGADVVKGLWNGITSMTTWISDNIKAFAGKIIGPFKSFFGIESPSTLMATFGTNLVEGLAKGIDETATKPVTSITNIAGEIGDTVETKWGEIETTTESKWTAVWNKTKDAWNDIATKVKDTTKEASEETKIKWDNVLQSTKSNWDEVQKKTQDTWNDVKAKITDMVKDSSDEVKSRWAEIETETNDRWGEVYDKTKETWDDIETKIKDTTREASGETKTKWSEILKDTESNWEGVWNRTKETWEDVKAKITDMVKGSSDETQEKWSNIKTTTDENWDKIYEKTKTTWESVKTDIVDAATESEQTWSEKSDKMLNTTKTTWEDIAQHVGDNLDKVNDYVQTTTSIIEKEFELWVKQNNIVKDSSEYLAKQLEVQQEKHELLNEQIKATREALEKATEKYGEHSLEALKLQEKLLNLQLSYSALGKEIDSATDAINRQTSAMQKQIEISRENGRLSVRTDDSYFSRSSSDWYTWTDDEGKFRSGSKDDYDDYTGRSNITDSEVNRISREHGVDLGVARDMAAANERAKKKGNLPIYHWGGWVGKPLFDMEGILEKLQGMLGHDERLGLLLDGEYVLSKDILNKFRDISTGTPTPSGRTERSRGDINQTVNIYSPTPLSPSETARKQLQASRQLAMEWGV